MKLTSPNDVKRPDKPNVDHIIEVIEKKFEVGDFVVCTTEYDEISIEPFHDVETMKFITQFYMKRGWSNVTYKFSLSKDDKFNMNILFYC